MDGKVIHELVMGEYTTKRLTPKPFLKTDHSRILEAARQRKEAIDHDRKGAIRYKDI